jgi:uncharacterized membrane protein YbhN (UPF0104 family)
MGVDVGVLFMLGVVPLTVLISRLPISIGGLGVYEGIFALLMFLGGVSASQAVAIAFAGRILETVAYLPWWIVHMAGSRKGRPGLIGR